MGSATGTRAITPGGNGPRPPKNVAVSLGGNTTYADRIAQGDQLVLVELTAVTTGDLVDEIRGPGEPGDRDQRDTG